MTIHRAKGLEFDAVIVPGLSRRVQGDPRDLLELVEWREGEQTLALFGPIEASDAVVGRPSVAAWIRRLRSRRIDRERARLLYVAMTRAKRRLAPIACFTLKKDGAASIPGRSPLGVLRPAISGLIDEATRKPRIAGVVEIAASASAGWRRWPVDFEPPEWPADLSVSTLNLSSTELEAVSQRLIGQNGDPYARAVGIVIHRELEHLARQSELPVEVDESATARWRQGLLLEGVARDRCDTPLQRVRDAIQQTLRDERGRWILGRRDERDGIELALTGKVAGRIVNVVIDRCFVEAGQRWVIDYKTAVPSDGNVSEFLGAQREAHRAQLARYSSLLARLGPEPVRSALYFPATGLFLELT
jgi:ATP-dependent exoDNAse (exonuclease V) beta subunit